MEDKKNLIVYPSSTEGTEKTTKYQRLIEYLAVLGNDRFTGHLKIHFSEGAIGKTEKYEVVLKSK